MIFSLARTRRAHTRPGRRRRLHRRRLLLHQLDQLRQPGDQRRAHVLRHLRRDRAGLGARLRRRAARRRRRVAVASLIRVALPRRHAGTRPPSVVVAARCAARHGASHEHRPVRLPAQRRALADEPGAVRARRRRPTPRRCRPAPLRPSTSTRRSSRSCASSASTSPTARPQLLTRELAEQADVVVTMGCGDACPYIPGKRYIDWDLEDPPVSRST